MAQYTPNLHLYKPEDTDDFRDFLSHFGINMDILDQGGGGGSANIVNCTQAEYDLLPSSKESDNVLYVVYSDGGQVLDPDYSYHKYGDNDEIIVRVYHEGQSDQQTLWFFRGWNQTSGDVTIPSTLTAYKPTTTSPVFSANYPNGGTSQDGWIGFYNNNIRAWNQSTSQTATGIMYGVVDISGGQSQTNPYVADPYVYIPDSNATRRIYMNGREYAEFNSGGGGTGDVADVEVNGVSVLDPDDKIAKITSYKEVTESEYEAIPVAERESNGIAYFINDLNNESVQGYPPLIYSDEEREIGVWRDGKPLYEITIDCGALPNSQSKSITTPNNLEYLVNAEGFTYSIDDSGYQRLVPFSAGGNNDIRVDLQEGVIRIVTFATWNGYNAYLTIRYTKTTDVAGSGIWNGQGGIAHHYSTNETVIGTWVDGKPLYEKTFNISSSIPQNTTYVVGDITNFDLVEVHGIALLGTGAGFNIPYYNSANEQAQLWWGSNELKFYQKGYTVTGLKITIQYTKTTD